MTPRHLQARAKAFNAYLEQTVPADAASARHSSASRVHKMEFIDTHGSLEDVIRRMRTESEHALQAASQALGDHERRATRQLDVPRKSPPAASPRPADEQHPSAAGDER